MDPVAVRAQIRAGIDGFEQAVGQEDADALADRLEEIIDHCEALAEWYRKGGF